MEYYRGHTYTQRDEEKVRLIPFAKVIRLHLSHAFFDVLHQCVGHASSPKDVVFYSTYDVPTFSIGNRELTLLNNRMYHDCVDRHLAESSMADMKDVLCYNARGYVYIFKDEGTATLVDVYRQLWPNVKADGEVIFIPRWFHLGIRLDKDWYTVEEVLGKMGDGCRGEDLENRAKIFLQKFFPK